MMLDKFISENNGKVVSYDNDPTLAGQAIQLMAAWCRYIGLPFQWANPYEWWDDSDVTFLAHWEKVVNDRKNAEQLPSPGDIVIFDTSLPGSNGVGHGSVFVNNVGANSWVGFDANWGGKSAHLQSHNWSYVLGWFTPKNPSVVESPIPTPLADHAPALNFELKEMEPKSITLKNDAYFYNLNDVDWESFQYNVRGQAKKGTDVVVRALAKHRLGGTYLLPDASQPYGYRLIDCDDHNGNGSQDIMPEEVILQKVDHLPKGAIGAPIQEGFEIKVAIPKYASRGDALSNTNSTGAIAPGTYYVSKLMEGAFSVTNEPGHPLGWWINQEDLLTPEEKLMKNWRTTYKPFRDQFGNIASRFYRALNDDVVSDLETRHRDLSILRHQPILIRGWFIGPDGTAYGRPDDCVSKGDFQWYGVRRSNLQRIPDEAMNRIEEPEMVIDEPPIPRFRDKLVSILPPGVARALDIVKIK